MPFSFLISSKALPVPLTTQANGFSAIETGKPVALRSTWSRFESSAPPPVRTIPLSTISAASSGAVFSKATFTASTICETGSAEDLANDEMVRKVYLGQDFKLR